MSNPAEPSKLPFTADPQVGLRAVSAARLTCLFEIGPVDHLLATRMAISALQAYAPESHADYISAARIVAFSLASVALLGKAASRDMSFSEQMRAYSRANALHRSANQSERTMMQRRRDQRTHPPTERPAKQPKPVDAGAETAAFEAGLAGIMKEYRAACPPRAPAALAPQATPAPAKVIVPQPQAVTVATAIRSSVVMPQAGRPEKASFKADLLRQSAIYRAGGQHSSGSVASPARSG